MASDSKCIRYHPKHITKQNEHKNKDVKFIKQKAAWEDN